MKVAVFILFCIGISVTIGFSSCKKHCQDPSNPECENYNPCYGKTPVTASMIMDQSLMLYFDEDFYETGDTVFPTGVLIRFRCQTEADRVIWVLGKDTVEKRQVERSFGLPYGKYPVTLIVHAEPNLSCFPEDDGWDTLTRYVHLIPVCELNVFGTFKVLFDGQTDSTLVGIKAKEQNNLLDSCVETNFIELTNFDGKGSVRWDESYFSYNHLYVGTAHRESLLDLHATYNQEKNTVFVAGECGWHLAGIRFKGRRISN